MITLTGELSQATSANQSVSTGAQGTISDVGQVRKVATTYLTPGSQETLPGPGTSVGTGRPFARPTSTAVESASLSSPPVVPNLDNIVNTNGGANTAKGVNALDNFQVNGVDYEPPDQGLCVGNGYVIDVVNTVLRVYTTSFKSVTSDVSPNTLDGVPLSAFTSDPRCIYDQSSGHWFLTQLLIDSSGSGLGYEYIAVSKTSLPLGAWYVYALNVTDSFPAKAHYLGQTNDPGCPCFGDQPLLGASRDALVVSTNEYSIFGSAFNGAQVYLLDMAGLASGRSSVTYVHLNALNIPTPDGQCLPSGGVDCWYSVNPAASPTPSQFDNSNGGTEYALSSLDFQLTGDNRLAGWAFTNTESLKSSAPEVHFSVSLMNGLERYYDPVDSNGNAYLASQKPGPTPLGDTVFSGHPNAPTYGCKRECPEGLIQTNGDGMFDTVVYAQGALWGAVDTEVTELVGGSSSAHAGVAYWVVKAYDSDFKVLDQGYVAARGEDIMFPSIGVGPSGDAVITFTLTGIDYYPSTAFGVIDGTSGGLKGNTIFIADAGMSPYDATTEYQCSAGTCPSGTFYTPRFGDYTWAVWYNGNVYFATEYIQYKNCANAQYRIDPSCGQTRGPDANWGTSLNSLGT
jgi:hypothetical protein